MEIPAPPQHAVRPTFAILIAIFVGMFSLLFGLGSLFDSEGEIAPAIRVLLPVALLAAPIVLAIRLRPLGAWTAVTAGALASGVVLVFGLPVAFLAPAAVGVLVLTLAIVGTVVAAGPIVESRRRRPAPSRRDR